MSNKVAYFLDGNSGGLDYWVTDGTAQGTTEVSAPGSVVLGAGFYPGYNTPFGSRFLLESFDTAGRLNLVISNGTSGGTIELRAAGASPYGLFQGTYDDPRHGQQLYSLSPSFTVLGSEAVFAGVDAANRIQLWTTDGTATGTRKLAVTGSSANGLSPTAFVALGSKALFSGENLDNHAQLFVTDGTAAGTQELHPAGAATNGFDPYLITPVDGKVIFSGIDTTGYDGLWVSDGTNAGTTELTVANANTQPNGLFPLNITPFGNDVLFSGYDSSGRYGLWISDGTSTGTHELLPAGAAAAGLFESYSVPTFTAFGADMLFYGNSTDGNTQLWITDGTQAGTHALTTSAEGQADPFGPGGEPIIAMVGAKAVFGNYHDIHGKTQLWVTDGTAAGTSELTPAGADSAGVVPQDVISLGATAVFIGADYEQKFSLWATDGTTAGTHEVIPPGLTAAALDPASFQLPTPSIPAIITGGSFGPSFIEGTPGDDTILAAGAGNTINGYGGSDTITAGDGGYSRVIQGSLGDGATGTTAIILQGRANTVTGGDEDFNITGGTGFTGVTLGNGDDTVSVGGPYNTVTVGGGNNVIDAGGGFSKVAITGNVGNLHPTDTINFAGEHNQLSITANVDQFVSGGVVTLTGGTGYGVYALDGFGGSVTTDGLYNTISFATFGGGRFTTIQAGSGYDTVDFGGQSIYGIGGGGEVFLAGTHNRVKGEGDAVTVTGGTGNGTFGFDQEGYAGLPLNAQPPSDTYNVTTGGLYNAFSLLDTNTNTIVAGSGGARVSIVDPILAPVPGLPPNPPLIYKLSDVTFAGINNSLTAADGPVIVEGGSGNGTFALGSGDDSVTTGGSNNKITLGQGHDTVSVAGDHASVTLDGSNAALILQGSGDKVFLSAGASGTLGGGPAPDLHVYVTPGIGLETINGLAADSRAVITLSGGAGGYASASQVIAALNPDGHGGSFLAIGSGGLDFTGVAPAELHAGMFTIS